MGAVYGDRAHRRRCVRWLPRVAVHRSTLLRGTVPDSPAKDGRR